HPRRAARRLVDEGVQGVPGELRDLDQGVRALRLEGHLGQVTVGAACCVRHRADPPVGPVHGASAQRGRLGGAGSGSGSVGGGRLASMIAAALHVPLPALLEDPSIANNAGATSLDTSTILVMQARQKVMDEMFRQIFKVLGLKVRLRWPEISEEPIHRRMQALDMAIRLGLVSADEARAMVLDAWHDKWEDFDRRAPRLTDLPLVAGGTSQGTPKPPPSANPGKSS